MHLYLDSRLYYVVTHVCLYWRIGTKCTFSLAINDKHIVCRAIVGIRIFLEFSRYFVYFCCNGVYVEWIERRKKSLLQHLHTEFTCGKRVVFCVESFCLIIEIYGVF